MAAADLQHAGGGLTAEETAELLGLSVGEVERLADAGRLLMVPTDNGPVFPHLQFRDGQVLPGLIEARADFPDPSPWAYLNYVVNPDVRLGGRRPTDCLKAGDIDCVISAARQIGEQSAA